MTNFDEFFGAFIHTTLELMPLIRIDNKIFDLLLDVPIKELDIRELNIRTWLAQRKFFLKRRRE